MDPPPTQAELDAGYGDPVALDTDEDLGYGRAAAAQLAAAQLAASPSAQLAAAQMGPLESSIEVEVPAVAAPGDRIQAATKLGSVEFVVPDGVSPGDTVDVNVQSSEPAPEPAATRYFPPEPCSLITSMRSAVWRGCM